MNWFIPVVLLSIATAITPDAVIRRDEARLINQIVRNTDIADNLRVWDPTKNTWRNSQPSEQQRLSAKVLVINLWAHYCKPCAVEFPVLRTMAQRIESSSGDNVKFLFISETSNPEEMGNFITENRNRLPSDVLYLDYNENIAERLRLSLPSGSLTLPTTLILDEKRIVRYAMFGAVLNRRSELATAIADVLRSINGGGGK